MRMTAMLLLVGCLQVSASGIAQKVSINRENVPLKKVFTDIKRQTGYLFFYNARLLDNAAPVSVSVKDADMKEVLDKCFKDQSLTYKIVNRTIVISPRLVNAPAEAPIVDTIPAEITVTGTILDDSTARPIEGASVMVRGTNNGVASNSKGAFVITGKKGAVLTISYVGYEAQTFVIRNSNPLQVKLKQGAAKNPLANVVVTGYQLINKESFTGNAVTVSGEELRKVNPVNVLQSIQAFDPSFRVAENNLAGSNPNRLPNINLRGSTALPTGTGDILSRANLQSNVNLPTFILDGYEVSIQKVYDLDNSRIQSITLLKDAAATAVYGSRAANGVVVITTKQPKAGKLQVFYNSDYTVNAPDLTDYRLLDAAEKLEYEKLAGLYTSVGNRSTDMQEALYYSKKKNVVGGVNTYWLSQPLRVSLAQKHSIYLEGGGNGIRYGLDMRYQTQPGVMKGSSRDRYSIGVDLAYNPSTRFLFKNTLSVTQMNATESPWGGFSEYVRMNPYYPKTDSLGNILQSLDNWLIDTHRSGADQYVTDPVLNPMYNSTLHSFNKNKYLEFIDAFSGEWTIVDGLRLRGLISVTKRKYDFDAFTSPSANYYYYTPADKMNERGNYSYSGQDETWLDGNINLAFNKQVGDHFFNTTLGANIRTLNQSITSFTAIGFPNDRFTNVGFALGYAEGASPGGASSKERLLGSFLSTNYSYKNKYLLDASLRTDGSSKFGTDNKVATFWSLGIGWNVHKEANFRSNVISMLKLRASTGITGAVNFASNLAKTTFNYYSDWYSTGIGAIVTNYGNNNLKWQQTRNIDAGIDLGLFKDRIMISPRYYQKLTTDMLSDITLAPSTGFGFYKDNLGDMLNEGFELNMKATVLKTKDWFVNLSLNMARNTNKIVRISNALKAYNDKVDEAQSGDYRSTPLVRYVEGESLNTIYAVRSLGIDPENGRELFLKKNGTYTYDWDVKDIVAVADNTPIADGFFGSTVSWKNFLVQVQFYTKFGGKEYNQTLVDRVENADPRYNVDRRALTERWKQPGDIAKYKNIASTGSTNVSDRFIQRDNVLELNSIYCSYDFNKSFCKRLAMRNLRASFTMNDVYRWSSMEIERGLDYPFARAFTFSIQTSF
ncbi:SusC/RagA family TonB-linked outer membrane protein [Paraflavitalea sp. CAU 1676]|uniref:SusC/RagA family TonB-linked outer membrane protein n=1 Tax=Paraflavitalea sp. CAU 1676 TaxID=3032598 RepID=UPI0023DA86B0|nr:SusC/RagA family TonB-linked outer membrane protein [Paraflavitalea sp. CAU 1676]MDF2188892.1 SusC/RagA family TonB-linked outer membrane protein [Paraflavitalea sp. CAU 1676]